MDLDALHQEVMEAFAQQEVIKQIGFTPIVSKTSDTIEITGPSENWGLTITQETPRIFYAQIKMPEGINSLPTLNTPLDDPVNEDIFMWSLEIPMPNAPEVELYPLSSIATLLAEQKALFELLNARPHIDQALRELGPQAQGTRQLMLTNIQPSRYRINKNPLDIDTDYLYSYRNTALRPLDEDSYFISLTESENTKSPYAYPTSIVNEGSTLSCRFTVKKIPLENHPDFSDEQFHYLSIVYSPEKESFDLVHGLYVNEDCDLFQIVQSSKDPKNLIPTFIERQKQIAERLSQDEEVVEAYKDLEVLSDELGVRFRVLNQPKTDDFRVVHIEFNFNHTKPQTPETVSVQFTAPASILFDLLTQKHYTENNENWDIRSVSQESHLSAPPAVSESAATFLTRSIQDGSFTKVYASKVAGNTARLGHQ